MPIRHSQHYNKYREELPDVDSPVEIPDGGPANDQHYSVDELPMPTSPSRLFSNVPTPQTKGGPGVFRPHKKVLEENKGASSPFTARVGGPEVRPIIKRSANDEKIIALSGLLGITPIKVDGVDTLQIPDSLILKSKPMQMAQEEISSLTEAFTEKIAQLKKQLAEEQSKSSQLLKKIEDTSVREKVLVEVNRLSRLYGQLEATSNDYITRANKTNEAKDLVATLSQSQPTLEQLINLVSSDPTEENLEACKTAVTEYKDHVSRIKNLLPNNEPVTSLHETTLENEEEASSTRSAATLRNPRNPSTFIKPLKNVTAVVKKETPITPSKPNQNTLEKVTAPEAPQAEPIPQEIPSIVVKPKEEISLDKEEEKDANTLRNLFQEGVKQRGEDQGMRRRLPQLTLEQIAGASEPSQDTSREDINIFLRTLETRKVEYKRMLTEGISESDHDELVRRIQIISESQRKISEQMYIKEVPKKTEVAQPSQEAVKQEQASPSLPENTTLEKKRGKVNKLFESIKGFFTKKKLDKVWFAFAFPLALGAGNPLAQGTQAKEVASLSPQKTLGQITSWRELIEEEKDLRTLNDLVGPGALSFTNFISKYAPSIHLDVSNPSTIASLSKMQVLELLQSPGIVYGLHDDQRKELCSIVSVLEKYIRAVTAPPTVQTINQTSYEYKDKNITLYQFYDLVRSAITRADTEQETIISKPIRKL